MNLIRPTLLVKWLRAAGEPTRLRLLMLCAEVQGSVSDFAHALKQSEPRVSRHLKILTEAGLTERWRQGQWVQYRIASGAEASSFVRGLLAQADRRDPQLVRDTAAARDSVGGDSGRSGGAGESRLGRALAGILSAGTPGAAYASVLVIGVAHLELLESAARLARQCTALAPTRRAAQGARAYAEQRGFNCRVLHAAAAEGLSTAGLARAGTAFDAVVLDRPLAGGEALTRALRELRRVMRPGARLWLFESYDSLESARERIVEHPLARLRRLLAAADLVCERLSPIEADGQHVLAASARLAADDAAPARRSGG
ncbi:MAG TPA: metalloregulator ArsR/SmtB family transcription factor [Steroidobacteraceae bacterium]|jgi:DNA-binding transcriptional ArsR family regulator|nr:metalloregulator ArsR/SmtB family transcription factor [Steroidobacteraceae bacterium]